MRAFGYPKLRCLLCNLKTKTDAIPYTCEPDYRCVLFHKELDCFTTRMTVEASGLKTVSLDGV